MYVCNYMLFLYLPVEYVYLCQHVTRTYKERINYTGEYFHI